jgi:hypothetical protein
MGRHVSVRVLVGIPVIIAATLGLSLTAGAANTAPLTLSANNRVFISRMVGLTSGAQSVTITNNLSTQLVFSSIHTTGDFAIASNTCGTGIAAQPQCSVGVTFTPTALGARQGTISINYTGVGSPALVALSGTGNDTALTSIVVTRALEVATPLTPQH